VEGTTKWTRYGTEQDKVPATSHTLTKQLNEDTFYEFRVAAENKAGVGPYSDISERVKTLIGQSANNCFTGFMLLLQPLQFTCGTLFRSSCAIQTSPADRLDDS